MASPMQLREAVKIIDVDHIDDPDTHARARSIVDAAVEAHERFCAWQDTPRTREADAALRWSETALDDATRKLRALERGEEIK